MNARSGLLPCGTPGPVFQCGIDEMGCQAPDFRGWQQRAGRNTPACRCVVKPGNMNDAAMTHNHAPACVHPLVASSTRRRNSLNSNNSAGALHSHSIVAGGLLLTS